MNSSAPASLVGCAADGLLALPFYFSKPLQAFFAPEISGASATSMKLNFSHFGQKFA